MKNIVGAMSTQVKEENMGAIRLATSNSTDEEYGGTFATQATDVAYDNTTSGLTADDVQGAIDEAVGLIATPYQYRGIMGVDSSSKDFNDYKDSGTWKNEGTNASGTANAPNNADNGWLVVYSFGQFSYGPKCWQYWYGCYQGDVKRRYYNGAWTNWTDV